MSLEKEAEDFLDGKRGQFYEALDEALLGLEYYLKDNLHNTRELQMVFDKLTETEMWITTCVERYGIQDYAPPDTVFQ